MATPTYTLIDSVTLSSSATTVTFSSIDQSYRDLVLVTDVISDTANTSGRIRLNSMAGSTDYQYVSMAASSSATRSDESTTNGIYMNFASIETSFRTLNVYNFLDYSDTSKYTSALWRLKEQYYVLAGCWRFSYTAAVTNIDCIATSDAWGASSSFYLYGIEA